MTHAPLAPFSNLCEAKDAIVSRYYFLMKYKKDNLNGVIICVGITVMHIVWSKKIETQPNPRLLLTPDETC